MQFNSIWFSQNCHLSKGKSTYANREEIPSISMSLHSQIQSICGEKTKLHIAAANETDSFHHFPGSKPATEAHGNPGLPLDAIFFVPQKATVQFLFSWYVLQVSHLNSNLWILPKTKEKTVNQEAGGHHLPPPRITSYVYSNRHSYNVCIDIYTDM